MKPLSIPLLLLTLTVLTSAQGTAPNGLRRGKWRPQDVPDSYQVVKVGRYDIQTNCTADVATQVGKHMTAMFKLYKKSFPTTKTPTDRLYVKLFKSRKGFRAYGAPGGAAAYYSKRDKEMVGYFTGKLDGKLNSGTTGKESLSSRMRSHYTMDTLGVFSHEGWHQYYHWACGSEIPFPSWSDEGIGEYFYSCYLNEKKKLVVGAPCDTRLSTIQRAIRAKKFVPLNELVLFDQRRYYAQANLCYAQGWSLCHFFMEHPDYKKKRFLQRYVKIFTDQHSIKKAAQRTFKKMNWKKVEADWKAWILAMTPIPNPLSQFDDRLNSKKAAIEAREALPKKVAEALDECLARRRQRDNGGKSKSSANRP